MSKLYAENILIGSQWQVEKTITFDQAGIILSIDSGKQEGAVILDGTVIPGMVNCHSHAFQRAFAGYSEYRGASQDSFWSWRDIMYRFVKKLTPEDAHIIASFVYREMLKAGFTSVAEFHYLHHQQNGQEYDDSAEMSHQMIKAAQQTGIAFTHLPVLYSYAGFWEIDPSAMQARFIHTTDNYIKLVETLAKEYSSQQNFKLGIAPHSLRAVSQEQVQNIIPMIKQIDKNAPIHIHIAEQKKEVEDCINHYGKRPVEWLLENFEVDEHFCLVHATHLNSSEIVKLAKTGSVVGICPLTEANLGDGIFPAVEYIKNGGRFAIGSDSHISINVAEELRLLEYSQRLKHNQRALLICETQSSVGQFLYTQAVAGGAQAIAQNVSEIAVGKRADFVVLDNEQPSLFAKNDSKILDAAIFACNELPVKDVFVAGVKVISDKHHSHDSKIISQYKKVMEKLTSDL